MAQVYRALQFSGADRADRIDDPDLVAAVDVLRDRFHAGDPDDDRVRHALGWWHEVLAQASTDPAVAEREHTTAVEILLPIYRAAPDKVPEPVAHTIAAAADAAGTRLIDLLGRHLAGTPGIDLDEAVRVGRDAVDATALSHSDRSVRLSNLGAALQARFGRTGQLNDLDGAIEAGRTAAVVARADDPEYARYVSNLGGALRTRFERTGHMVDLEEAIRVGRAAVAATPKDHPDRAGVLSNLGLALRARFERTGDLDDLGEALKVGRAAVAATPRGRHDRPGFLSNLGAALHAQFERTGHLDDLDEAIEAGRDAVEGSLEGHSSRPMYLSNLCGALLARFNLTGQLDDLDEAIEAGRDAVVGSSEDHPDRPMYLSNLGLALRTRFNLTGHLDDLDQAVQTGRDAVVGTPEDHPDRPKYLSNLGIALRTRFERTGNLDDLDQAVQTGRDAVESTPGGHSDRGAMQSNLCLTLKSRFEQTGRLDDLHESVEVGRAAVAATPQDHLDRPGRLSNLVGALQTRFERTGQMDDLEEAIVAGRDASGASAEDHPGRPGHLWNLGNAVLTRFEQHGRRPDREEAIQAFEKAAASEVASPVVVCASAARLGRLLDGLEAVAAFERAARLLPRVAPHGMGVEDSIAQLGGLARVGRDGAAACLAVGDAGAAVMMVESARAVVFTRTLQTRTDLDRLAVAHPDLAARIAAALGVLNRPTAPMTSQLAGGDSEPAGPSPDQVVVAAREAALALEEALAQVRQLPEPGWDRFFLPPLLEQVVPAAAGGPVVIVNVAARRCDALIVTEVGVTALELPLLTEDDAIGNTNRFLGAIDILYNRDATPADRASAREEVWGVCGWLWDTVTGPVLEHLGHDRARADRDYPGWPRVWWIPTGPLTLLPLHAAGHHTHPDQPGPVRRDQTVIDRVVSSITPTLGALLQTRTRAASPPTAERMLVAGLVDSPDVAGTTVDSLPAVGAEVAAITDAVSGVPVTVLTDVTTPPTPPTPPTKPALTAALPGHAWTHIACHAVTDPDRPTLSQLLLADHEDDPFTVLDMTGLALPDPDLLYLSACTTARTGFASLDDPVHFAAAAQLAGYRHVIATLWPLYDDAEPASIIYQDLTRDGHPVTWDAPGAAAAVHHATHHLRESGHQPRETPQVPIHAWATLIHLGP